MIKYKCSYCGGYCELIVRHNEDKMPYGCPFDPSRIKKKVYIVRPAEALPDWCKVGRYGFDNEQKRYFEIVHIDEKWVDIEYLDDGNGATCSYTDMQNCSEARKPCYKLKHLKNGEWVE